MPYPLRGALLLRDSTETFPRCIGEILAQAEVTCPQADCIGEIGYVATP